MNRSLLWTVAALFAAPAFSNPGPESFAGRWDLTIVTPHETYPSWMSVEVSNGAPEVHVVGRVASVHPGKDVKLVGTHLSFTTLESFGKTATVTWEMTVAGGKLTGVQKREDGTVGKLSGDPAPPLKRPEPKAWSAPEAIFNGKDLTGWEPLITEPGKPVQSNWKAEDGILVNESAGANLRTTRKFSDFRLHVEYNCPQDGNSGVYLRGRYEVQVEYEAADMNDKLHGMGSIYGFLAPASAVSPRPGQWESYDVTLVGRTVTIVRDDVTIIDHQEIPGITGGALDSHEANSGPLYIQGDHTGGMKYRNITIAVPKS
jgi:Domain of Unknown Function (DUF1080)